MSPAYYGNAVGVTRWTTTESFIGGVKVGEWDSEKKYKKYSMTACPLCKRSKKQGRIQTIALCSCGKDLSKVNVKNYKDFASMAKSQKIPMPTKPAKDDFFWTKLLYEKRNNWQWDSKNKAKLLEQALNDKYDLEGAHYGRDRESD